MAMNVTPFVGTDNFNMETFNNMISQINDGVNSEISDVLAQLGTKAKIQTGSYVGTGTYGAANPCSLTFDFVPKMLWLIAGSYDANGITDYLYFFQYAENWLYAINNSASIYAFGYSLKISVNNYTISWYTTAEDGATQQGNSSNKNYSYIAIG